MENNLEEWDLQTAGRYSGIKIIKHFVKVLFENNDIEISLEEDFRDSKCFVSMQVVGTRNPNINEEILKSIEVSTLAVLITFESGTTINIEYSQIKGNNEDYSWQNLKGTLIINKADSSCICLDL